MKNGPLTEQTRFFMDVAAPHIAAPRQTLWLRQKPLSCRLAWLFPELSFSDITVTTSVLAGNAAFVNYVHAHRFVHPLTGAEVAVVEKSLRKPWLLRSLETRLHRSANLLHGSTLFQHPACLGVIDTPLESLIFSELVQGRAPSMPAIATRIAPAIAELEHLTHGRLHLLPWHERWTMDFFRPWYLVRTRFNYTRLLPHLRALAATDARFAGLAPRLAARAPALRALARHAKTSPACLCHLDYLRKNLFVGASSLKLIDWSEVKAGRIGFDAGAYLFGVFRRNSMERYLGVRDEFLAQYLKALAPEFCPRQALRNARYAFAVHALWHCLRPKTIAEYRARKQLPLLHAKLVYLLALDLTPDG